MDFGLNCEGRRDAGDFTQDLWETSKMKLRLIAFCQMRKRGPCQDQKRAYAGLPIPLRLKGMPIDSIASSEATFVLRLQP